MEKVLPKLYGAIMNKEDVKAESKDIAGQKIPMLGGPAGLYCGRAGRTIVIGPFPDGVAEALGNGTKEKGWLAEEDVAKRAREFAGALGIFGAKPATLALNAMMMHARESRRLTPTADPRPRDNERAAPRERVAESKQMPPELMQVLEKEQFLLARVTRREDRFVQEGTWPGLKSIIGPLVDLAMRMPAQRGEAHPREAPRPDQPK